MILVDLRHPFLGRRHAAFVARFHGLASSARLDLGDLNLWSRDGQGVVVEIKKPVDLVESVVHSGRLLEQMRAVKESPCGPWAYYLILEQWKLCGPDADGDLAQRVRGGWRKVVIPGTSPPAAVSFRRIDSFLTTLQTLERVIVKATLGEVETAAICSNLYHWWQRDIDSHTSTTENREYLPVWLGPKGRVPLAVEWAGKVEGIGYERRKAAGRVFRSGLALAQASVEDWMRVEGIGRKLAERAYWAIRKNGGRSG